MSKKYRIRLQSRRILGPYVLSDIQKLFKDSSLNGDEFYQLYPSDTWSKVESFPEIEELKNKIDDISKISDSTIVKMTLKSDETEFVEYKFRKDDVLSAEENKLDNKEKMYKPIAEVQGPPDLDKTKIIKLSNFEDVDKTVVNNNLAALLREDVLKEAKKAEKIKNKKKISDQIDNKLEPEKEQPIITYEDKTQILNLKDILPELKNEIIETEKKLAPLQKDNIELEQNDDLTVVKIKKKGMKPLVAFCFLAVLYMLFFDENKELPLKPLFITLKVPIVKSVLNVEQSVLLFRKGKKLFDIGSYTSMVKAYSLFRSSVQLKYNNNPAFGYMVYCAANIFMESNNRHKSANIVFELLQMKDALKIKDEKYVLGASVFFRKLNKANTSQYYLDNYLRIKKKLTPLFLNEYIKVALINGEFDTVKSFLKNLKQIKSLSVDGYLNLATFEALNENFNYEKDIIKKAIKSHPKSTKLYLYLLDMNKRDNQFSKIDKILAIIKKLKAENRPTYFAKFYEYLGYHYASKGEIKKATRFFKKSLKIVDSDSLRSRLAGLDVSGIEAQKNLILESKVVSLMTKTRKHIKKREWLAAFTLAIDAVEIYPGYIPSSLLLAEIQIKRGYFGEALKIIKDLKENYPMNASINFTYINTFIESGKLADANIEINLLGGKSKLSQTWKYASYLAKYYSRSNNFILTLHWLTESLKRNPLNPDDYFRMSQEYFTNGRFKRSKYYLNKAMFLEPKNIAFHVHYSKILYELEGIDTAIGYLRNLLIENQGDIEILSAIAIYYYKDGKYKDFKEMKAKIEKLNSSDPNFYKFLIKSAKLSDNNRDLIKYTRKLADVEPADIQNKVLLGQYLFIENKLSDAKRIFSDVLDRLPSYPRVHYFMSKIHLTQGKMDFALKEAKLEIKYNPGIYYGYFIAGEVYRRMEKFGLAITNLEKALSIDRRVVETLKLLGWIRLKQNFLNQALEFYLMAKRLEPNQADIYKNLGIIYEKVGQRKLAAQEYLVYLQLYPNAPDQNQIQGLVRSLEMN